MQTSLFQSILLGFVQGITEFLPISSSGHLAIMSHLFNFPEPSLSLDIALHLGTLGAVLLYFWKDWFNLLGLKKDIEIYQTNRNLFWYLVLASFPIAIIGFILDGNIEKLNQNPIKISLMILTGCIFLFLADRFSSNQKSLTNLRIKEALTIGFFQVLALLPGISRSGMTIGSARLLKLNKIDSTRFSFLLGTPTIFGAVILHLKDFKLENFNLILILGISTSFFVGILTIHFFLSLIKKINYFIFLGYSLILIVLLKFL